MRNKLWLGKALGLVAVCLMLALVLAQIERLVRERLSYQQQAGWSVRQSLAEAQTVLGPVLSQQCTEQWETVEEDSKGVARRQTRSERLVRTALPSQLSINGELQPEARYRGLFKVNTYVGRLAVQAEWKDAKELQAVARHGGTLACTTPQLLLSVSDARGLRSVSLKLNGESLQPRPGSGLLLRGPAPPASGGEPAAAQAADPDTRQGLHAQLPRLDLNERQRLDLQLDLVGTESFAWAPAAENLQMQLRSSWPHASFGGRFLPVQREASDKGFQAEWRVSALATTAGTELAEGRPVKDSLGVELIDPVNPYSLSERAMKYAILFIALVFVAVALIEVLGALRVHPVQYLLVGLALGLFFLLLLALSEHLAFALAYALAGGGSSALLAGYAAALFKRWRAGALFGAGVGGLYAALYQVLNLEQTALLMGSLLLFAVLGGVMFATRRIDWYAFTTKLQAD
ncbi:cell envelope integrity protein CreD [Inhella proteolytica]|uniref:Inner membrane CreD family protein n=1 Tax=Inhella proteolytica TaxID=2795029 RepID=A0A931NI95_9BURK|nr:cell envelope integrity protein CreD [Inhella proteolytica]MBH9577340.1 inner membrane CreD family protein [Inhella proteolytica]